jgi:cell division septum initiation protein DivIVA
MSGSEKTPISDLPRDELEALTERLLAENAELKQAVAELRAAIAQLKGAERPAEAQAERPRSGHRAEAGARCRGSKRPEPTARAPGD